LGVAAIAIGIYTKVEIQNSDLDSSPGEAFNIAPIALILLGFFIVFLGSLGLWGGGKEDRFYISLVSAKFFFPLRAQSSMGLLSIVITSILLVPSGHCTFGFRSIWNRSLLCSSLFQLKRSKQHLGCAIGESMAQFCTFSR